MRLRNKQTGEIVESAYIRESHDFYNKRTIAVFVREGNNPPERVSTGYETLAGLNEEWEDYEEPEGWWFIDHAYKPHATNSTLRNLEADRQIGNYFESEEEAEKAVKKLKAWQRLKDKGFRFRGWDTSHHNLGVAEFFLPDVVNDVDDYRQNLDLLFYTEVNS